MRRSMVMGPIAFVGSLVLGLGSGAQSRPHPGLNRGVEGVHLATQRQVVTGRVCMPDGSPAAGAVVVTSAGGQAVTGADGSFALTVELPLDAESVEVTAVADERAGSGSLVASAQFVPAALSRTTSVGQLALTLSSSCHPRWLPTFGEQPGTNGSVNALAVFDDLSGPVLYAGGSFTFAGGVMANHIARWDGTSWSALGSGMSGTFSPSVSALTVYDDGSGPALYAGGSFTSAGGVSASRIAKWDGTSWSALGSGMSGTHDSVSALTVYDDGSGPALYAGGGFLHAGGSPANNIAKWDGSSWSALGSGVFSYVSALTVYDDGGGPALYAGGSITSAGGVAMNGIARWDGSSWSALGSGLNGDVLSLAVHDDGSGPALYVGGVFTTAGGVVANRIARWDGSSWSTLGSGMNDYVHVLTAYDDGSGPALYAGGRFTDAGGGVANHIAKWDGSSWSALSGGVNVRVLALTAYDDGSGPALYAGGGESYTPAGSGIGKWDGSKWSALNRGMNGSVLALTVHDDGGGPALYAGGAFFTAGGMGVNRIAKWDGSNWSALGSGLRDSGGSTFVSVLALTVFDDGGGPALYAGGDFTTAGSVAANQIAKWDGSSWSALGSGMGGYSFGTVVRTLTVYDDGGGPALYAGGVFTTAGSVAAFHIAKWDGSSWTALGNGISGYSVDALAVFDDGSGPALYAGGNFGYAGSVSVNAIAKWDGSSWSALGSGLTIRVPGYFSVGDVSALAVHDDGSGPALYVGGDFTTAGGVPANGIARWNGSSWSAVGGGFQNTVLALTVHDDGRGPKLYAGGQIGKRVARWDGSTWTSLGSGISAAVRALASWDDGEGPALYAGGDFMASPAGDSFLAKWGCRTKPTVKPRKL